MLDFVFVLLEPQLSCVNSNRQKSFQTSCVRFCCNSSCFCLHCFWELVAVVFLNCTEISCQSNWDCQHFFVKSFVVLMMFWVSLNVTFSCVFLSMEAIAAHDDVFYLHWRFFRWKYKLLFVLNVSFMFVLMYLISSLYKFIEKHPIKL